MVLVAQVHSALVGFAAETEQVVDHAVAKRARKNAARLALVERGVLLTSLLEAADRVDSTCGVQMAYVKQWAPRSFNALELRMPAVLPRVAAGPCRALRMDANAAVRELDDVDVAYLDPPYNQHSYLSNYHVWESLVLWDAPEVVRRYLETGDETIRAAARAAAGAALKPTREALQVSALDLVHCMIAVGTPKEGDA